MPAHGTAQPHHRAEDASNGAALPKVVACCLVYAAGCMLHVALCLLYVACSMLHVALCLLLVACFMHVAWCIMMYIARWMVYVACCTLHVVRCTLHGVGRTLQVACRHIDGARAARPKVGVSASRCKRVGGASQARRNGVMSRSIRRGDGACVRAAGLDGHAAAPAGALRHDALVTRS